MKRVDRRHLLGLAALGGAGVLASLPTLHPFRRSALAFGTQVSLTLLGASQSALEPAFSAGFAAIRAVERAANLFDPTSEIARLNRTGRLEAPSPILLELVRTAVRLAEASAGAFDPTMQPVWAAWRSARDLGHEPDAATLARAVALVDYQGVRIEPGKISLAREGMALSLNGLAQGYAADLVLAAMQANGVAHAFIDTGELGARGARPGGTPWRIGIANPRLEGALVAQTDLPTRRFAATSADNACHWRPDFSEHHIIEPWSGHSPQGLASVSIIAQSGILADGLSTAAMVLGEAGARALLSRLAPEASALFIDKSGAMSAFGPAFAPAG